MARYFFHITDGLEHRDQEGLDLPDDSAARIEAARALSDYIRDHPQDIWDDPALTVTVVDDSGLSLFSIAVVSTMGAARIGQKQTA